MDEKYFEQAGAIAETMVSDGIEKARRGQLRPADFEGFCLSCGAEVPALRIEMRLYNCVDCQSALEHRSKLGMGNPSP